MSEEIKKDDQPSIPVWAQQMLADNKQLKEKIKMFEDMAGKNEIASYEFSKRDVDTKYAQFKIWEDEVIIGWSNLDYSQFRPAHRAEDEGILVDLIGISGKKFEKVNFVLFDRVNDIVKLKIAKTSSEMTTLEVPSDYKSKYNLERDTIEIPTKFLNR